MTADSRALDGLRIERGPEDEDQPFPRWALVLLVLLLLAAAAGLVWWLTRSPATPVATAVAGEARLEGGATVLNATGYVTARRQATVSSKVTGKIEEVYIEEGQRVYRGDELARLDTSNARASLRLADAELGAARSSLDETQVLLAEAMRDHKRTQRLVEEGVAGQAELDDIRAEMEALEARLARQRQEVRVAEEQVAFWEQEIEDRIIRAPFEGVVVAKNAQPGEMISPVSAGGGFTRTGIGTIVDMTSLEIEVDVNEAYINRVREGQQVEATLDAYPDWPVPAHVIAVIPTADRQKATVRVRVGIDDLDPRILPDMGVKVAFQSEPVETGARAGALVPQEALRRRDGREVLFVVREGRAERRAVTTAGMRDGQVLVVAGLQPGERVVLSPPEELATDDPVELVGE